MKKVLLSLIIACTLALPAQVNWSSDIAPIFYKNCTSCHNPNGIAPFSLMDYNTASVWGTSISTSVSSGSMPPWKADTSYKRFVHERILTDQEKSKIIAWVNAGTPSGDLSQAPAPPVYPVGGVLGTPDLKVTMPTYTSKATATKDDYVCIVIPSGLSKTRKIKALEVVPGNRQILHHTLVFIDSTNTYQSDTIGGDCGAPNIGKLVTAYAPGGQPTIFPNGDNFKSGMTLPANSNIILAMHYPEGSAGLKDYTSVNFYFYDENETGVREISASSLLANWNFCIPANTVKEVDDLFPTVSTGIHRDISLLSVFPHSHLLGKTMESYMINSSSDTTPLIHIPHWDFEWQDFYFFKEIQKLERGSHIYGRAVYDNRSSNPHNPYNPPRTVCAGLNTSDEMMLFYFHYMDYQPGDELVNVDSLMQVNIGLYQESVVSAAPLQLYPNPAREKLTLSYQLENAAFVNLDVYNINGELVRKLVNERQPQGKNVIEWNRSDEERRPLPGGVYFYSLKIDEQLYSGKFLLQAVY